MKMRNVILISLIALAPAALAADFGIRAGQYREAGQEFVGVEMLLDAGVVNVNPNIEYNLDDNVTSGSANLDVTVDIAKFSSVTPYAGAGLGLLYVDDEIGGEETKLVGNLIGGVAFDLEFLKPYAQLKYFKTLEQGPHTDEFAVTIGLRF